MQYSSTSLITEFKDTASILVKDKLYNSNRTAVLIRGEIIYRYIAYSNYLLSITLQKWLNFL